jgi:hypothetical protein
MEGNFTVRAKLAGDVDFCQKIVLLTKLQRGKVDIAAIHGDHEDS